MDFSFSRIRITGSHLFFLALCVYAFFGSPTPDHPGIAEVIIAALLVWSVGISGACEALRVNLKGSLWFVSGQILLLYGLSAPVLMCAVAGHDAVQALRDIFPFLFLVLPVFLHRRAAREDALFKCVLSGAIVIGVMFALRGSFDFSQAVLSLLFPARGEAELTYFANAPTVLFAALFIAGRTGQNFFESWTVRSFVLFLGACALSTLILSPVALTTQRASLGYAGLYVLILLTIALYKKPYRALTIIAAGAVLLLPLLDTLQGIIYVLAQKTALVGSNARFEELTAVWAEIAKSPQTLLFGTGWGGSFESPAVAEIRVNYTHSLLSSALLKTGLAGFILVIFYLFGVFRVLRSYLRENPVFALALAGPFLIDVFLYASFKSLDFGVILLLVCSYVLRPANVAKAVSVV